MCLIANGFSKPTGCDIEIAPGIEWDGIWIGNKSQMTFPAATDKVIASISMDTGTTLYKLDCHRGSISFSDINQPSENSGDSMKQTVTARVIINSSDMLNKFSALRGADLAGVLRGRDDQFYIFGQREGLRVTQWEFNTGAKAGDDAGLVFTLEGEQQDPADRFFDGSSVITTEILLDSYLT